MGEQKKEHQRPRSRCCTCAAESESRSRPCSCLESFVPAPLFPVEPGGVRCAPLILMSSGALRRHRHTQLRCASSPIPLAPEWCPLCPAPPHAPRRTSCAPRPSAGSAHTGPLLIEMVKLEIKSGEGQAQQCQPPSLCPSRPVVPCGTGDRDETVPRSKFPLLPLLCLL